MKTKVAQIFQTISQKFTRKEPKYKKLKMEKENRKNSEKESRESEAPKKHSLKRILRNLFQRLVVVVVRFICRYVVFGERGLTTSPPENLVLLESATSIAYKIRHRKLTSVEVMKIFIDRIKEVNPILNCVVDERFSEALRDAAAADKLIESGTMTIEQLAKEKPFLGVPISTKDCLRVEGLLHTAGIYNRKHIRGENDAEAMRLMREAGAIPFALTNVSEVCMWWESSNTIHGRTNNPYDTFRIVGGSSGGEGCLQAAAGSPFGLGSDIGGSIRMPAFFNGIFGHKPSKFVVSNEGQYPEAYTYEQDAMLSVGPMSRFATDLKPMMRIITVKEKLPLLRLDEPVDLSKVKIYYQESDNSDYSVITPVDKDIKDAMQKVVRHFKNTVKTEVSRVNIERLKRSTGIWMANIAGTADTPGFDEQLLNLEGKISIWKELIKWIFGQSKHTLAALFTATLEKTAMIHGTDKYKFFMNERNKLVADFEEMLHEKDAVFLYPTHPTPALYHNEPLFRALNFTYTAIINVLGMPATSIPLGLGREKLPIGIQVVGGVHQDRLCLAVATELERVFGGWVAPGTS